jgi:Cu(I)/Ag(I) efflux system membrane fusion protein
LKPGMLASLSFDGGNDQTLLIPSEAIIRTGRRTLVMIVRDNGHFAPVSVLAGREADGRTEILAGLAPGQRIVASGQFLLDSESNLQHGLDTMDRPDEKGLKP